MTRFAAFCFTTLALAMLLCKADAPPRRLIYAIPEALPKKYAWNFRGDGEAAAVWTGFRFDRKGRLYRTPPEKMPPGIAKMHEQESHLLIGLKDSTAGIEILGKPEIQSLAISSVNQILRELPGISAVQIDFEYLPPANADAFVRFIRILKKEILPGVRVYTAVFPPVGLPEKWSAFHNLPQLADASDGIVVMLYDYHGTWSGPGCVSGIGWLDKNAKVLSKLPPGRVWLGAPLYGYRFQGKKVTAIRRSSFEKIRTPEKNADGCRIKKSEDSIAYYPGEELYSHYEKLVRDFGFAGIAYWRAGLER